MGSRLACIAALSAASMLLASCGNSPSATSAPIPAITPATSPGTTVERKELALAKAARVPVVNTLAALEKGDLSAAKAAWASYDYLWNGMEAYVNYRSLLLYNDLELNWQAKIDTAFAAPGAKAADVLLMVRSLLSMWDDAIQLISAGPPISPLFDDLADIRIARQPLRQIPAALITNDIPMAKALFALHAANWTKVSGLVRLRSQEAFDGIEAANKAVNDAFAKATVTVAVLNPLVADAGTRYSYGQNLIATAARKADFGRATFAQEDVGAAGGVRAMQAALDVSLTAWNATRASWRGADYTEAKAQADKADAFFATAAVAGPLRAKALDVALKTPLDTYVRLAGAAGDAAKVAAANKAAYEACEIAIQGLVGQFWTDPKLAPAIATATPK